MKQRPKIILTCPTCNTLFRKFKHHYDFDMVNRPNRIHFCSRLCRNKHFGLSKTVNCSECGSQFEKKLSQMSKTKNNFCSKSCAASYNNTHKTTGTRRSKLELWLECKLQECYPNIEVFFNDKDAINSELDIYFPSLKIAFELNGIFHYEPIFGESKLDQIQNNDNRKFQASLEKGIELCIIDTSGQKYFKEKSSQKYLDIITNLVNSKLESSSPNRVEVL